MRKGITNGALQEQAAFGFATLDRAESEQVAGDDPRSGTPPAEPAGGGWPADLTRRLRVLLHTLPLDGVRRADANRDTDLRHYDGLSLSLHVLDLVIDRLGLEAEADREVVTRALQPVLSAMDAAAGVPMSAERHERILDRILGALRNDGDARRPFREE